MSGCGDCKACRSGKECTIKNADYTIALAGNANVGKSVIFNQLTGVDQIIGNWPGKTVERAEGLLLHKGKRIRVIDLPGIYSFSTYSMEELVSRDFIALEHPDAVVNVIDASAVERNLFFTIQLLELAPPLMIAVNQIDLAEKKGITIDTGKLSILLGVPVVSTVAIKGKGIPVLTDAITDLMQNHPVPPALLYGKEIEERIAKIISLLERVTTPYPVRWTAIKLLERDPSIVTLVSEQDPGIAEKAGALASEIESIHGEPVCVVMSAERYQIADRIAAEVMTIRPPGEGPQKKSLTDKLDAIALHPVLGYLAVIAVIGGLLLWTFLIGAQVSGFLQTFLAQFEQYEPVVTGPISDILWNGAFTGFVAGVTLVIPYVLPFYLLLAVMEDSGYLTRISVMLDRGMHKLGLHGKAIIPMILGYGCNVPAIYSCRIMETPKQKTLAAFLVTLVPCTARTVVILGLVAAFVNIWWALALYAFDILLIIVVGRIAFKAVPGESVGLIMEMPDYHVPSVSVVLKQTWTRTKSLIWIVFPAYIIGSAIIQGFYAAGWLNPVNALLSPITVLWLGLPAVIGITLIFGIVRKELTILTLAVIFHTTNFATILTPVQLIVLALVSMLYIPCISAILVLASEFGWRKAVGISVAEIVMAIAIGGVAFRVLSLVM
ncbi:MAG: ferrous iron transport protein B [Methanoculleus sp.]|uniref:ferrous iron transport protein B n=1 Tax=Methanoculleus sp. TaxID=90427 RepID=UPI00261465EA|nr:ferrous iron transport protein B [Methanoculleus sp.]MDD2254794.1 ferrous iron transport protein B [Methanoculleus sp.]MDD4471713.1 ferrous iron transport protein B [Methanoculleus sp.]